MKQAIYLDIALLIYITVMAGLGDLFIGIMVTGKVWFSLIGSIAIISVMSMYLFSLLCYVYEKGGKYEHKN